MWWWFSCVRLFVIPWIVARQAPLSIGLFSRHEYWSGLPFPSPGDRPDPRIEPESPALQVVSLPLSHLGVSLEFIREILACKCLDSSQLLWPPKSFTCKIICLCICLFHQSSTYSRLGAESFFFLNLVCWLVHGKHSKFSLSSLLLLNPNLKGRARGKGDAHQ